MKRDNTYLKKKAAYISLIVGLGMFVAKIGAYMLTGSSAIFSDAAESVVHVAATGMALFSIILASRPADKTHLYGHGNIEYFSAGVEGLLIIIAAVAIIYESSGDILGEYKPSELDVGAIIIGAAGIGNLVLGFYLIRRGKATNSLTLVADGKHVLTDSYTSIGVVVALVLVLLTDFYLLDPLIAIAIALNILFTGYKLIRESVGGLMNETDLDTLNKIGNKLIEIRQDFWIDLHQLRFWTSGDRVFIDFHLTLPFYFTIKQSHEEEERISDELNKAVPNAQIRIHLDYCGYDLCCMCDYAKCAVRKEEQTVVAYWVVEKLIGQPYEIRTPDEQPGA